MKINLSTEEKQALLDTGNLKLRGNYIHRGHQKLIL